MEVEVIHPQLCDQETHIPIIPLHIRLQELEAVENDRGEDYWEDVDEESFFETRLVEIKRPWYWNPKKKTFFYIYILQVIIIIIIIIM